MKSELPETSSSCASLQVKFTTVFPGDALNAPAARPGRTGNADTSDEAPSPPRFVIAVTRNQYWVPFFKPFTMYEEVVLPLFGVRTV